MKLWESVLCDTIGIVRGITQNRGVETALEKSLGIFSGWILESATFISSVLGFIGMEIRMLNLRGI